MGIITRKEELEKFGMLDSGEFFQKEKLFFTLSGKIKTISSSDEIFTFIFTPDTVSLDLLESVESKLGRKINSKESLKITLKKDDGYYLGGYSEERIPGAKWDIQYIDGRLHYYLSCEDFYEVDVEEDTRFVFGQPIHQDVVEKHIGEEFSSRVFLEIKATEEDVVIETKEIKVISHFKLCNETSDIVSRRGGFMK